MDDENKMRNEGNVELARKNFLESKTNNLDFLLSKRYEWMNEYLKENQIIYELGGGQD